MVDAQECFANSVEHEGENKILTIRAEKCTFPPSIEYSAICMGKVIDLLLKNSGITTIKISQLRQYEYDYAQVSLLVEVSEIYRKFNKDERFMYAHLVTDPLHERYLRGSFAKFQQIISKKLKEDPFAAYVLLKRLERQEKIKFDTVVDFNHKKSQDAFIQIIAEAVSKMETLRLLKILMPHSKEYKVGERDIYGNAFHPTTRPDFMYTKLVTEYPDGNLADG